MWLQQSLAGQCTNDGHGYILVEVKAAGVKAAKLYSITDRGRSHFCQGRGPHGQRPDRRLQQRLCVKDPSS